MSFRARVDGSLQVRAALMRAGVAAREMLEEAMVEEAEDLVEQTKPRVPERTGELRASGHVTEPDVNRTLGRVEVAAGFGGSAGIGNQGETNTETVGYAIIVHERTELQHDKGEPKYLEKTADEFRQGIHQRVAARLRGAVEAAV